jgi:hypothetical protein
MDPATLVLVASVLALGGLLLNVWRASVSDRDAAVRRALAHARAVPGRALVEGMRAKIHGRVVALEPLLASPLGGDRCVCWRVVAECEGEARIEESKGTLFALQDPLGARVHVDATASIATVLNRARTWHSGLWLGAPNDACEAFLARHDRSAAFGPNYTFTEWTLCEGTDAAALGDAMAEPDAPGRGERRGGPLYREGNLRHVLRAPADGALYVTDVPRLAR